MAGRQDFSPLSRAVLATVWQADRPLSIRELAAHLGVDALALEPVLRELVDRSLLKLDADRQLVVREAHPRFRAT